jgi:hypothetical protein
MTMLAWKDEMGFAYKGVGLHGEMEFDIKSPSHNYDSINQPPPTHQTTPPLSRPAIINIKMRTSTLFAGLSGVALSTARLTGISAPSTISNSKGYTLNLITENYIQSVADIAVAWGYAPRPGFPGTIGSSTGSAYLGPDKSNQLKNVPIEVPAPSGLTVGQEYVLGVSLFSLYGASGTPTTTLINVTVTVGDEVSEETVKSNGFTSFTAYS